MIYIYVNIKYNSFGIENLNLYIYEVGKNYKMIDIERSINVEMGKEKR